VREVIAFIRTRPNFVLLLVVSLTAMELIEIVPFMFNHYDEYPDYYYTTLPRAFDCNLNELPDSRNIIKWYLHCLSFNVTGYPNAFLMPFAPLCIPLVYLLGFYLTKDRMIGLLSILAMIFNPLYSNWTTTGTYDQVWTFFILLSIVLLYKSNTGSFISLGLAMFAKSFSIAFFPLWVYSHYKIKKNYKVILIASSIFIIGIGVIIYSDLLKTTIGAPVGFFTENIEAALFTNIGIFWEVLPALAIAASLSLQFKSKIPIPNKRLVSIWLIYILGTTPVIHLFTMQGTFGYRYVIFAAFMSIFISMTLVQFGNWFIELVMKKTKLPNSDSPITK
jgi:hypothetical protein